MSILRCHVNMQNIECEVKLKRKDMRAHEEDDKIKTRLQDSSSQLQDTISRMEYGLQLANQEIKLLSKEIETWKGQKLTFHKSNELI